MRRAVVIAFACALAAGAQTVTDRFDETFRKYTKRFFGAGADWRPFKAQAMAESNVSMEARSWVGARGIMQLMPSTFSEIQTRRPEMASIDDPEWNIAAGVYYDSQLRKQWTGQTGDGDLARFMFGSYNAGRRTLLRAQNTARERTLDPRSWLSIETVAPEIREWRHKETLDYVQRIEGNLKRMTAKGRVVR